MIKNPFFGTARQNRSVVAKMVKSKRTVLLATASLTTTAMMTRNQCIHTLRSRPSLTTAIPLDIPRRTTSPGPTGTPRIRRRTAKPLSWSKMVAPTSVQPWRTSTQPAPKEGRRLRYVSPVQSSHLPASVKLTQESLNTSLSILQTWSARASRLPPFVDHVASATSNASLAEKGHVRLADVSCVDSHVFSCLHRMQLWRPTSKWGCTT